MAGTGARAALERAGPSAAGGFRLHVVDTTVINGPEQKAVQWRAHVSINPTTGGIRAVELTDDSGVRNLAVIASEPEMWS